MFKNLCRAQLLLLPALIWLNPPLPLHAGDVSVYLVRRGLEYFQTDSNLPVVGATNGYGFGAEVDLPVANSVTNASIQPPFGLPAQTLVLAPSLGKLDYKKKYNTLTALYSHYPDGAYTFTIFGKNDGLRQPVLQLAGSTFPSGPHIANFTEVQNVNPNGYIKVVWDAFPGGGTGDYIQFRVDDLLGNKLFETPDISNPGACDGTAFRAVIGPGILNLGQTNKATLNFQKTLSSDGTSYPGAQGISAHYARTTLSLVTSSAAAPDVKLYEVAKAQKLIQTGPNTIVPQTGTEFVFSSSVQAYSNGVLTAGNVLLAPANSPRVLAMQPGGTTLNYSDSATSQALLDANYPSGTDTLVFPTPHDGSKSIALQLPATSYPQIPRFSNFSAIQNVNVTHPFTVSWDPWIGGTVYDYVQVRVEDQNANKFFETPDLGNMEILDGRATSAVVPGGVLPAGQTLEIHVTFVRFNRIDTSVYPGVLGLNDFQTRTKMSITTYASADVQNYSVAKGQIFKQTDSGAPASLSANGFQFEASVVALASNTVNGASVSTPFGAGYALAQQPGGQQYYFNSLFADQGSLDAAFPNGTYTEHIGTLADGLKTLLLTLTADLYPNPPHLTDFAAAQVAAFNSDFPITWDPFVNGGASDFIQLRVSDLSGTEVFRTPDYGMAGAVSGFATSAAIPSDTLKSNQLYNAVLVFKRIAFSDNTTYPGALGYAAYTATTLFRIVTQGSAEPPSLQLTQVPANGGYQLSGEVVPGLSYRIEGSSNLVQWLPLTTNTATTTFLQWLDPANRPARFYRTVVLP